MHNAKNGLLNSVRKVEPTRKSTAKLWWESTFEKLEARSRIPDYKKIEVLRTIFNDEEIAVFEKNGVEVIKRKVASSHTENKRRTTKLRSTVYVERNAAKGLLKESKEYTNVYMEYMKKSKQEIHSCVYGEEKEKTIMEKAEMAKNEIVQRFMETFKAFKSKKIDANIVSTIFDLPMTLPITTGLMKTTDTVAVVPDTTVDHLGCFDKHFRNKLLIEAIHDIQASEKPPKITAFGKQLPGELRRRPFTENPSIKWARIDTKYQDIESFAEVWKNITDLESTRGFCMYLLDHPEVKPPPFLKTKGLLIKNLLKKPVYLGNLETELELMTGAEILDVHDVVMRTTHTGRDYLSSLTRKDSHSLCRQSHGEISDINIII